MRKFFTAMNDALVAADESGDAESWIRMYAFGNALFEGIFDSRAPGSASQSIIGHDHTDSTVTGYHGGRPLARNVIYSGMVEDSDSVHLYAASPSSANTWTAFDEAYATDYQRTTKSAAEMFRTYVSAGFDSTGSPPSAPPYLKARFLLVWEPQNAATEWDVRLKNVITGDYSAVGTVVSSSTNLHVEWCDVSYVPASDGWCGYSIEVQRRVHGSHTDVLYCDQFILFEDLDTATIGSGSVALGMS
jgi:hypothetical protein